jgi:hypothetical protein
MAATGADSPSQQPFLASPRGILTPRTLTRSLSFAGGTPSDIIKAGIQYNRNELVLLFSRCVVGCRKAQTQPATHRTGLPAILWAMRGC